MKNNYLCPKCKGHLQIGDNIIFSAKTEKNKRGLILLNPQLGNYTIINHPSFKLEQGEKLDILCSICHKTLSVPELNKNLVKVLMIDEENNEYELLFSRIVGEKCTFKIKDKKIEEFGEHSSHYLDFLNLSLNK